MCIQKIGRYQVSPSIAVNSIIRARWRWSGVLSPSFRARARWGPQPIVSFRHASDRQERSDCSYTPTSHRLRITDYLLRKLNYTVIIGYYLISFVKFVQQGCKLELYNNVPEDIYI